ncbi:MAG: tetratricopeptide repeat protein, partial [Planctomycetes bacterium]|nr:tetratricopeptide repeat protein [Planctomycetota bacterium]
MRLPTLRAVVLVLIAICVASGADSPTNEEWQPVAQAIADHRADAETQVQAIVARYPRWADGWTELARVQFSAEQAETSLESARKALALAPTHGEAAPLAIQALLRLGRPAEAVALAAPFTDRTLDRQLNGKAGWVNYYAAEAALTIPDFAKATAHLTLAKACAGGAVPGEFHMLDARLAIRSGDLVQAEASLIRATTVAPRLWDAWYELGRVRSVLAEREKDPLERGKRIEAASQSFATVVTALPDDHESWLGLGRCQVNLGKIEIDSGNDQGQNRLNEGIASLKQALERKAELVPALLLLGEALVRLEKYDDAVAPLTKARELGATDQGLLYNLALALEKTGRADEASAIHSKTQAVTAPELISKGMTLYKAKMHPAAINHLGTAVKQLDDSRDRELKAQVLRCIGHAWLARVTDSRSPPSDQDREDFQDRAAKAYAMAGELNDWSAKQHYAALQSQRSPAMGYEAGWQLLRWSTFTAPLGWKLVAGNYGASRAWATPLHYVLWGLAAGLPALLWLITMFGGRRRPVTVP